MNNKKSLEESSDQSPVISTGTPAENDSSLEALVREEQSLARERLREKLGREPSQAEADQWLREQTEGY